MNIRWGYAISGDLPIVLLRIGDPANIDLMRQIVQAHAYRRLKGLAVDLVIWNEEHAGYRQSGSRARSLRRGPGSLRARRRARAYVHFQARCRAKQR
jgi:cellobiose phosphorylase